MMAALIKERRELAQSLEVIQASLMLLLYPNAPIAQCTYQAIGRDALFYPDDVSVLARAIEELRR